MVPVDVLTGVILPLFVFTATLCIKLLLEQLEKIHDRHLIKLWPTHYSLHICSAIKTKLRGPIAAAGVKTSFVIGSDLNCLIGSLKHLWHIVFSLFLLIGGTRTPLLYLSDLESCRWGNHWQQCQGYGSLSQVWTYQSGYWSRQQLLKENQIIPSRKIRDQTL